MLKNRVKKEEYTIKSSIDHVRPIIFALEKFCRAQGVGENLIQNIALAADEAITNIVTHGYENKIGMINARFILADNLLTLEFRDQGEKFQPNLDMITCPKVDLEGTKKGGFGLYIMKQFMDDLEFTFDNERGQNLLILRKKIHSMAGGLI